MKLLIALVFLAVLLQINAAKPKKCSKQQLKYVVAQCNRKSAFLLKQCLKSELKKKFDPNAERFAYKCYPNDKCCRSLVVGQTVAWTHCYKRSSCRTRVTKAYKPYGIGKKLLKCRRTTCQYYKLKGRFTLKLKCNWVKGTYIKPKRTKLKPFCKFSTKDNHFRAKLCCSKLYVWKNNKWNYKGVRNCKWMPGQKCLTKLEWYHDRLQFPSAEWLKEKSIQECKNSNKWVWYSCVFDRSRGIYKAAKDYAQLVRREAWVRAHHKRQCTSTGDPHIKTFSQLTYNLYNADGWRPLINKKNLRILANVQFDRRWGLQGINAQIKVIKGRRLLVVDRSRGVITNRGFGVTTRGRWTYLNIDGFALRIYHTGTYINFYATASKGTAHGCRGDCCVTSLRNVNGVSKTGGDPNKVIFSSAAVRKCLAYRRCAQVYNNNRGQVYNCMNKERQRQTRTYR